MGQPMFESKLEQIDEIPTYTHQSAKPPKGRKSNVAVGGHSASNYNNLSLYGHKKKRTLNKMNDSH